MWSGSVVQVGHCSLCFSSLSLFSCCARSVTPSGKQNLGWEKAASLNAGPASCSPSTTLPAQPPSPPAHTSIFSAPLPDPGVFTTLLSSSTPYRWPLPCMREANNPAHS
ncbi:hypothetical protein H1C71_035619 [Ictidomys tridecemlineatus]|nr:hypothetical protein H1C71_035619 [Ictidomys tridecemlineatus]